MQKSDTNVAKTVRRKVQTSTTLNRKYVKRPVKSTDVMVSIKRSPKVKRFDTPAPVTKKMQEDQPIAPSIVHPMQAAAITKMQSRTTAPVAKKMTAKELKDQAIQRALASASKTSENMDAKKTKKSKKAPKLHFGLGRVVLALSCAAAAVFAIVYFVNLNMPDISMRVAAMQTGIEATYPSYVPRDFSLSDITSENGKVVLSFKNSGTGDAFSLTEETSSWDSNALLANFVKDEYGDNYTTVREQGLTIYISGGGDAAWVNGGVVYKIDSTAGALTKKQINTIATSL
ncbi:hypothetical protein IJJ53_04065 [Candidatus Saccharibacteria bacterium]|nr:hypothetical protein [Candidatus Saccharibacteria bacterium]